MPSLCGFWRTCNDFTFYFQLLLEFDILYKKNIAEDFTKRCPQLCDVVLNNGDDQEVATFTHAARGKTLVP